MKGMNNHYETYQFSGKIKNDENGDIADDHYHRYLVNISFLLYLHLLYTLAHLSTFVNRKTLS